MFTLIIISLFSWICDEVQFDRIQQGECLISISTISKSVCIHKGSACYYEIDFDVKSSALLEYKLHLSGPIDTVMAIQDSARVDGLRIPADNEFHELSFAFSGENVGSDCDKIVLLFPVPSCE